MHLLKPIPKNGTSKIVHFYSSAGIFLVKEPKVTEQSVLLRVSITKCYVLVMLVMDLESTQITHSNPWKNLHGFARVSVMSVDGRNST